MNSILLVSGASKGRDSLAALLKTGGYLQIASAFSGSEARRLLGQNDHSLILINTPLPDELGHDLAVFAARTTAAGVVLLVKADAADSMAARVENDGVFVIAKPLNRQFFFQSLKLAEASRRRLLTLQGENLKLQKKVEEIRMIDRAKCVLIQYQHMTEPQAHRYIEKQAMDRRLTRREISQEILWIIFWQKSGRVVRPAASSCAEFYRILRHSR